MQLGNGVVGNNEPLAGTIRNLNIWQNSQASAAMEWAETGTGVTYVYHNGYLSDIPVDAVSGITSLEEGSHNISVVRFLADTRYPVVFYDNKDGVRLRLAWPQADSSVNSYKIYLKYNGGTWTETAEITERVVEEKYLVYPDSGTGFGRISVPGIAVEDEVNFTMTIEIIDSENFSYSYTIDGDTTTETVTFNAQKTNYLPYNVTVQWMDDLSTYVAGDKFYIKVGIATAWRSDELEGGIYDAAVTALDAIGNESAMLELAGQIFIPTFSDPVTLADVNQTAIVVDESYSFELVFSLPSGAAGVNIYTNYNSITGVYDDYINANVPFIANATGTTGLTPMPTGTLKFYLWPVTAEGAELRDFTLHEYNIPTTIETNYVLGTVEEFTANATITGYQLTFYYAYQEDDDIVKFECYRETNGTALDPDNLPVTPTATILEESGVGFPYSKYVVNVTDALTTSDNSIVLMIRATDDNGHYTYSEQVTIDVDDVAPTFSGSITGGIV